jgi:hypothetical protein
MSVAAPAVAVVSRLNPWWLQTARLLGHILRSSFPLQCTVRHAFAYDSPLKSSFVPPCLPSRSAAPPGGPDWIHEIKHDGFRIMARRDARAVRLFSRNGYNFGDRLPLIAKPSRHCPSVPASSMELSSCIPVASRSLIYCATGSTTAPLCSVPSDNAKTCWLFPYRGTACKWNPAWAVDHEQPIVDPIRPACSAREMTSGGQQSSANGVTTRVICIQETTATFCNVYRQGLEHTQSAAKWHQRVPRKAVSCMMLVLDPPEP